MDWKKLAKALLFPHIAIMLMLVPLSAVLLVGSMVFVGRESAVAYISYILAFYTLTVWCLKTPYLIDFFNSFKQNNRYAIRWQSDARLRVNVSLYGALAFNALYALFHVWLGFFHHTFWFYSLGAYYICLGVMRFFLLLHTRKYAPGENIQAELEKYRACGQILLVMNVALSFIVFFMVYWGRTFSHHMITTIAMAAYTFSSFAMAIVNVVKYRKYNSPVFSASKAISLASALVSMLTLECTMLTTFDDGTLDALTRRIMLGLTGAVISVAVILMAIFMITASNKKLKALKKEVQNGK